MAEYLDVKCIRVIGGDISKGDWTFSPSGVLTQAKQCFSIGVELKSISIETEREIGSRAGMIAGKLTAGTAGMLLGAAADKEKYVCALVGRSENRKFLGIMHQELYQLLLGITIEPNRDFYEKKWAAIQSERQRLADDAFCNQEALRLLSEKERNAIQLEGQSGGVFALFLGATAFCLFLWSRLDIYKTSPFGYSVLCATVLSGCGCIASLIWWVKYSNAAKPSHKKLRNHRARIRKELAATKLKAEEANTVVVSTNEAKSEEKLLSFKIEDPIVSEFKTCPFCAEQIKSAAILCRFCQKELQT